MKPDSPQWKKLVIDGARAMGMGIDPDEADKFAIHAGELLKWNLKINLTAITDPFEVAEKHFLDSIAVAPVIPENAVLLDIGSGGGFPGIPLKVLMPSLSVTLIDATRKKVNFLKHVIRMLKLDHIEACHVRAEDLARESNFANAFDVIVCRAFSELDTFVQMAMPLLAKDGIMIAMKGKEIESEMKALRTVSIKKSGGSETGIKSFDIQLKKYVLPFSGAQRSLFVLRLQT